jgi:hypothetical protein
VRKTIDITEKLSFDDNPALIVKGKTIEVNADAPTMLKVMSMMSKSNTPTLEDVVSAYELMFPEKSRKDIESLKLNFKDLVVAIKEGINLITGNDLGE